MTSKAKTFTGEYDLDRSSALFGDDLTTEEKGSLTRRLRADAKKEGLTLGETEVVTSTGQVGGVWTFGVKAPVVEAGKAPAVEPDLNAPAS